MLMEIDMKEYVKTNTYAEIVAEVLDVLSEELACREETACVRELEKRVGDGTCIESYSNVKSLIAMRHAKMLLQTVYEISLNI